MSETQIPSQKSAIDMKDLTIKSASGIALYWVINKMLQSETGYNEYLKVGLAGAGGLTLVAPILQNMIDGKNLLDGITVDTTLFKEMAIDGVITTAIYWALKTVMGGTVDIVIYRYVSVIASIIGADMVKPLVMAKFA